MHLDPRPIFRSRFFWFALPGLIFLLWGWFNDPDYYNGTHLSAGDHYLVVADNGRQIHLDARTFAPGRWAAPGFGYFRAPRDGVNLPKDPQKNLFSDAIVCGVTREPHGSTIWVNLSYWLLTLLHLAALLAIRLWWQRRSARLITAAHPQPAASHS